MYKHLTLVLLFVGTFSFAQENTDIPEASEESLSGDNLIVSWTLGEVVAGYGGFNRPLTDSNLEHARYTISTAKETKAAQLVKIHPNPAADFVVMHLKQVQAEELVLENSSGNILMRKDLPKSIKSYELDLKEYEDGVYYLTLTTDHCITLQKFKVIKSTVR